MASCAALERDSVGTKVRTLPVETAMVDSTRSLAWTMGDIKSIPPRECWLRFRRPRSRLGSSTPLSAWCNSGRYPCRKVEIGEENRIVLLVRAHLGNLLSR
jgi:hypothetical protein